MTRRMFRGTNLVIATATVVMAAGCGETAMGGPSPSAALNGTLGGKPFIFKSGFSFKNEDGTLTINFSDKDGACDDAKERKLQGGQTLVQFSQLGVRTGATANGATVGPAAVGDVTSPNDFKYGRLVDVCPSGTPVSDKLAAAGGRVKDIGKKITLTALSDTAVEGTVDLKYDDGSTLTGTFKVTSCPSQIVNPVCR